MQGLRLVNPSATIRRTHTGKAVVIDVEMINREDGLVVMADGRVGQVVHWFDASGIECEPDRAERAVACVGGAWITISLVNFVTASVH